MGQHFDYKKGTSPVSEEFPTGVCVHTNWKSVFGGVVSNVEHGDVGSRRGTCRGEDGKVNVEISQAASTRCINMENTRHRLMMGNTK